jgi:glycosyltransferase involved in cell wall biosynthesis
MAMSGSTMVKLTIVIATYCHEKYIRQALDGVLMQQMPFSHEILVGEDHSSDRTAAILKEYEEKFPGVFSVFYRQTNFGSVKNFTDLYARSRGEYLIILEGDDYWIDSKKLLRQVQFLDAHPDYLAVSHRFRVVDSDSHPIMMSFGQSKGSSYSLKNVREYEIPGQTTTMMFRNYYRDPTLIKGTFPAVDFPGDRICFFLLAANGKIKILPEEMSAYRFVTKGGTSFSANGDKGKEKQLKDSLTYFRACFDYLSANHFPKKARNTLFEAYYLTNFYCFRKGLSTISPSRLLKFAPFRYLTLCYFAKKRLSVAFLKLRRTTPKEN